MDRVLITGGNKGIGLKATERFTQEGFEVVVVARDFQGFGYEGDPQVTCLEFDLTDIQKLPELKEKVGEVDVLVNNAGVMLSLPYDDYPYERQRYLMKLNIEAPVELIKLFAPGMVNKKTGRVVNVSSIAGHIGHPDIWYGISKAGLTNVTKIFAKLLAPDGIVINAVAPGPVETEMMKVIPEARKQELKKSSYAHRFAKPEEVAETIFWLATDCPAHINGICVDINNGAFPR
jgi:3-oxoacyl-[acyl-carrier protein] reductase